MNATLRTLTLSLMVTACWGAGIAAAAEPSSQVSGTLAEEPAGRVTMNGSHGELEEFAPPLESPGQVVLRSRLGGPDPIGRAVPVPFGPWVNLDGRFGNGIGYDENYFNSRVFLPYHLEPGRNLVFGMISGGATEQGDTLLNMGAGYRHYIERYDRVLGVSAWYTMDDSNANDISRVGLNFESMGRYMDAFLNVYHVLDEDRELLAQMITGEPIFDGNNIVFPFRQIFEAPYSGFDYEVGGLLPFIGRHGIYGYVGGYFLDSDEEGFESTRGYKGRLDIAVSEDISVGVNHSDDDCFGQNTWVSVAIQFPLKRQMRWFKPRPVRTRLAANVHRQDRIPVKQATIDSFILAINPDDTEPFFVLHVDPNASSTGTGTFENPFMTLEAARVAIADPGDMTDVLRVIPRDDDTGTNLMVSDSLVLNDSMRMLASSRDHTFTATQGTFTLPGFTGGTAPMISHSDSESATPTSVITLANRNEVSGFNISGENSSMDDRGNGIAGDSIIGFNINNNTFEDYLNAVVLTDATGTVAAGTEGNFTANVMTGSSTASGDSIDGFQLTNTTAADLDLIVGGPTADDGNQATGNTGVGYNITADDSIINADSSIVGGTDFANNMASDNGTGGMFSALDGGTFNIGFNDNTFDDNTDVNTGVSFVASTLSTLTISSFSGNTITDSTMGNGVRFEADTASMLTVDGFVDNTITGNGMSGVFMLSDGFATIDADLGISGGTVNTISSNATTGTGHGIHGMATGGGMIIGSIVNNNINSNGDVDDPGSNAISFESDGGDIGSLAGDFMIAENTMTGNVGGGVVSTAVDGSLTLFTVTENTIGSMASPNAGPGIDVSNDSGTLELVATDNMLDSSTGAGIAYTQIQSTTGEFTITGNTIIRTLDDEDILTRFEGDAISIAQVGSESLVEADNDLGTSVIDDNIIGSLTDDTLGNAGTGIVVLTREASSITDLVIGNEDGDNNNGNIIANNGIDGVNFRRRERATVDNVRMVDNVLTLNGDDGFDISAENTTSDDVNILVEDNIVTSNVFNGMNLAVRADAVLNIDIIDNFIDSNQADGINTDEQTNDLTDLRGITGFWHTNIITNNDGHGIHSNAALGDSIITSTDLMVGMAGVDADGKSRTNLIDLNGLSGVQMDGPGSSVWTNNIITRNGLLALENDDDLTGHGFDIQGRPFLSVTLDDNLIAENVRDGLEIRQSESVLGGSVEVFATGNSIRDNGGRGVDILSAGDNESMEVALTRNIITGNGFEGVFVVNTASETQDQVGTIDDATELAADGAFDNEVFLRLTLDENRIQANGEFSNFIGTGLVMLVGTMDGGYGFTDDGGFADTRGGIRADVTDNEFGGNFGVDVYIQSFVSTVDPPDTAGTWDDTEFEVDTYEGDPLARLDLVFTGNSGDATNVTPDFIVDSNSSLAFYDNGEEEFKSRDDEQTDPGPFEDGDRRRNAQRLAARFDLDPDTPAGTDGDHNNPTPFLYAGIGQSTFRVDFSGNIFTTGTGFILDDDPFIGVGSANGASFPPAVDFGESPFGWTDADRGSDFNF